MSLGVNSSEKTSLDSEAPLNSLTNVSMDGADCFVAAGVLASASAFASAACSTAALPALALVFARSAVPEVALPHIPMAR